MSVWYYRDLDILVVKSEFMGMVILTSHLGSGEYCQDEWKSKDLVFIGEFE